MTPISKEVLIIMWVRTYAGEGDCVYTPMYSRTRGIKSLGACSAFWHDMTNCKNSDSVSYDFIHIFLCFGKTTKNFINDYNDTCNRPPLVCQKGEHVMPLYGQHIPFSMICSGITMATHTFAGFFFPADFAVCRKWVYSRRFTAVFFKHTLIRNPTRWNSCDKEVAIKIVISR